MRKAITEGEWNKRLSDRSLNMITFGGGVLSKSVFKCTTCYYEWSTSLNIVYNNKAGCPRCVKVNRLTEGDCHKRLVGRDLIMLKYSGTVGRVESTFKCLNCSSEWSAFFLQCT